MKNILFTFLFLGLIVMAQSQQITFLKTYNIGDDAYGRCVRQLSDGSYIVSGYVYHDNPGQSDALLLKADIYGDTTWTRQYGGNGQYDDQEANSVQVFGNGFIFTGVDWETSSSFGLYNVKTDIFGIPAWEHTHRYSLDMNGADIALTTDGGFATAGFHGFYGYYSHIWLSRFNSSGDTLWTRNFNYFTSMAVHSLKACNTIHGSGFIIAGTIEENNQDDAYLIKTDNNGDTLWTACYGGTGDENAYCVEQTTDGGYILLGTQLSGTGYYDIYCVKTTATGTVQWEKNYGLSNKDERGRYIVQTSDNNYVIAGYQYTSSSNKDDILLIKINNLGDTIWTRVIGTSADDRAYCLAETSEGGFIITGNTVVGGNNVVLLIKTDSNGHYFTAGTTENENINTKVSIFPNPISIGSTLSVQISFPVHSTKVRIFDVFGRQVKSVLSSSDNILINTNTLIKGVYWVEVIINNLHYSTNKIIIQ